ncbi:MAG: VanZ family protein [Proteobacteria bacterium]|nr:VanZ family protein [Pseudomonadota bacterium]
MISNFKWLALSAYWAFLTRSLLITCPWELFSKSLAETPPIDLSFEPISWLAHLSAYAVLGYLIQEASLGRKRTMMTLFVLAFCHSIACEFLQHLIPGRWPNVWDAVSNSIGLMLAFVLHRALKQIRTRVFPCKTFPEKLAA